MTESATPSTPSQGTSEGQASTENQVQANETPAQAERRKLKAKVNGKELDVYEDEVVRDYQKYASADEKLREAAQKRKEIEAFYEALENDPESILNDKRLPINKRELAMKWLTEQIEEELAPQDPREAEYREMQKKLAEYESKEQREADTRAEQERRQLVDQRREMIANTLSKAMELSPLSKDPEIAAAALRDMAMHMRVCKEAGYDVSPEELAAHVEKKNLKSYHGLANRLEGDELISFLGEEIVQKIRRADLSRIKKSRETPPAETADHWESRKEQVRRLYDPSELRSS
jgi:hypothetical protein